MVQDCDFPPGPGSMALAGMCFQFLPYFYEPFLQEDRPCPAAIQIAFFLPAGLIQERDPRQGNKWSTIVLQSRKKIGIRSPTLLVSEVNRKKVRSVIMILTEIHVIKII